MASKPLIVGYWAVQITPQMDFIKFGKNEDTVQPYKRPGQALATLRHLKEQEPDCNYYILRLFANGQMKTFDF